MLGTSFMKWIFSVGMILLNCMLAHGEGTEFSGAVGSGAFGDGRCIRSVYHVVDPKTGREEGRVTIEIQKGDRQDQWIEHRQYGEHDFETFEVVFDPETLIPASYLRSIQNEDGETTVHIEVDETTLSSRIQKPDGKIVTQRLELPESPFVVEPFFKYFLSREASETGSAGDITYITLYREKMKTFRMTWQTLGEETITLQTGSFDCYAVKIGSKNPFLKMISSGSMVYLDKQNDHAIVQTPVRRKLFGDEYLMELTQFLIE
jgi:antitoxin component of MazEF toxin-antitoxin module